MASKLSNWNSWLSKLWAKANRNKTWQKSWQFLRSRSWRYWFSLQWLPDFLETLASMVLRLGTLALAVFIIMFLLRLFKEEGYVVKPLAVPQELQKAGYTDEVAALRLIDALVEVKELATSIKGDSLQLSGKSDDFSLAVLGVGFSIRSLADQLRTLLGREARSITGEITLLDSIYRLNLRMTSYPPLASESDLRDWPGQHAALQHLLRKAAEQILLHNDPYRLALLCQREKRYDEAIAAVQYLLRERPEESEWGYLAWGIILEERNKHEQAARLYRRAVEFRPDFAIGWVRLSDSYELLGEKEAAIEAMFRNLALEEDNHWRYSNFGWKLIRLGELALADSIFELGLSRAATTEEKAFLGISYASAMLESNRLAKAKALVEQYAEGMTGNTNAIMTQALIAIVEQDTMLAQQFLDDAFEMDPQHTDAIAASINVASMLRQPRKVVNIYQKADWSKMDDTRKYYLWLEAARAYLSQEQSEEARMVLADCHQLDAYRPDHIFYQALAFHQQGQKDSCQLYLEQAFGAGFELSEEDQQFAYWQSMLQDVDIKILVAQHEAIRPEELPSSN